MSLDDVRAAIDRIDDQIVALLAQRQEQVRAAAAFKADDAAVRAPDRRAALLARVRERAEAEGADPMPGRGGGPPHQEERHRGRREDEGGLHGEVEPETDGRVEQELHVSVPPCGPDR